MDAYDKSFIYIIHIAAISAYLSHPLLIQCRHCSALPLHSWEALYNWSTESDPLSDVKFQMQSEPNDQSPGQRFEVLAGLNTTYFTNMLTSILPVICWARNHRQLPIPRPHRGRSFGWKTRGLYSTGAADQPLKYDSDGRPMKQLSFHVLGVFESVLCHCTLEIWFKTPKLHLTCNFHDPNATWQGGFPASHTQPTARLQRWMADSNTNLPSYSIPWLS
jgi:hypothetical protein